MSPTAEYAGFVFPGTHYGNAPGAFVMRQLLDTNYDGWRIFNCGGMHASDGGWQGHRGNLATLTPLMEMPWRS